jgi:hypothetical protein
MPSTPSTRPYFALLPQLLAAVAGVAVAPFATPPSALAPTAGESWLMPMAIRSVHIDTCRTNAPAAAWTFVAPQAELIDSVTRVRRTRTASGTAPRSGCDPAEPGTRLRVP